MISFNLSFEEIPIEFEGDLGAFSAPIVFYARHTQDSTTVLVSFIFVDFITKKLTYYHTATPENIEKLKREDPDGFFAVPLQQGHDPHSVVKINDHRFLCFWENERFFYEVDMLEKTAKLYGGFDLSLPQLQEVQFFASTFFVDPDDSQYFYLTAGGTSLEGKLSINTYRAALDLSSFEYIHTLTRENAAMLYTCPHTVRKVGKFILYSFFEDEEITLIRNNRRKTFFSSRPFERYLYSLVYEQYCAQKGIPFSKEKFAEIYIHIGSKQVTCSNDEDFSRYVDQLIAKLKTTRLDALWNYFGFEIMLGQGEIGAYNLATKEMQTLKTTCGRPAHFEIDGDEVYISSHNFITLDVKYLIWPAAIDRYIFRQDGTSELLGTFVHPLGYRYTSHRIYHFEGKPYFATLWNPNRLFLVDADTMQIYAEHNLGPNGFDIKNTSEQNYFCANHPATAPLIALEVSRDGRYIMVVWEERLLIFDMKARAITHEISYIKASSWWSMLGAKTIHCQYFE